MVLLVLHRGPAVAQRQIVCRSPSPSTCRALSFRRGRSLSSAAATATGGLPIVDISDLVRPGTAAEAMRAAGQRIDEALRTRGFLYVTGHGVPPSRLEETLSVARQFFALDNRAKGRIATTELEPSLASFQAPARGYQRVGDNVTLGKRDWHEAVDFYRDCPPGDVLGLCEARHPLAGVNKWPSEPREFKATLLRHAEDMVGLGRSIMGGVALAIGADRNFFGKYFDDPFWIMRAIRYPPGHPTGSDGSGSGVDYETLGCGRHTDYGFLTFVLADDTPGTLQVEDAETGQWADAEPIPGAFVVNCGDMLARWSGGAYKSTPHRVLRPVGRERISVPFFFEPTFNSVIEPLSAFSDSVGGEPQSAAVHYGAHLTKRVLSNFSYSPNLEKDNANRK